MTRNRSEIQIVEEVFKAIDGGEDSIDDLGLAPEELERYSNCLRGAGIVTSVCSATGRVRLQPTAVGKALLGLVRKLDELCRRDYSRLMQGPFSEQVNDIEHHQRLG